MNLKLIPVFVIAILFHCNIGSAQKLTSDIPYVENGHKRHVLDIYTPEEPAGKSLPVMFWIHGGGWQVGDKSDVALKPKALTERGFVFVSTNYRLLPEVKMDELIGDVAKSLGDIRRLQVAALDHVFNDRIGRHVGHLVGADAIYRFHYRNRVIRAQDADELAGIHKPGNVTWTIDFGRAEFRIHHHCRDHRVATRIAVLSAGQRQDRAICACGSDAIQRVMGVIACVIVGTSRNDGTIQLGTTPWVHAGFHAALERTV
ncbi:MAG: carboxylesterase family protein [Proteobacteria bacterium]|nr:carboxylesterase family protein [Pseudomonadota bacterium]